MPRALARILHEDQPPLTTVPTVPDWLAQLDSPLLRKEPPERPPSASDVIVRLSEQLAVGPLRYREKNDDPPILLLLRDLFDQHHPRQDDAAVVK